jgi:hypothetical protein
MAKFGKINATRLVHSKVVVSSLVDGATEALSGKRARSLADSLNQSFD